MTEEVCCDEAPYPTPIQRAAPIMPGEIGGKRAFALALGPLVQYGCPIFCFRSRPSTFPRGTLRPVNPA